MTWDLSAQIPESCGDDRLGVRDIVEPPGVVEGEGVDIRLWFALRGSRDSCTQSSSVEQPVSVGSMW